VKSDPYDYGERKDEVADSSAISFKDNQILIVTKNKLTTNGNITNSSYSLPV